MSLVLRDNSWLIRSVCFAMTGSGSCRGETSSRHFSGNASIDSGESWRELPAVNAVPRMSEDCAGDPCCELGQKEEVDELLTADGGMTTSCVWVWGGISVRT